MQFSMNIYFELNSETFLNVDNLVHFWPCFQFLAQISTIIWISNRYRLDVCNLHKYETLLFSNMLTTYSSSAIQKWNTKRNRFVWERLDFGS